MNTLKRPDLFQTQAYINGKFVNAIGGHTYPVTNPADGAHLADVADCHVAQTRSAIEAADVAFASWKKKTSHERGAILRKWFDLQMEHRNDLGRILALEQGKPLAEATGEIVYGASFVEWFAEEGKRIYGDVIPANVADKRYVVIKQPIGVSAAITPWNFPNAMITRKVSPALAAGCTVVVKPAEDTPLSALALAVLAEEAGIPAGVFNVVTSNSPVEVGKELCANPLVRKLSFTGSTEVGKILMRQSADTVKKVSFELGGNAPFIVFDDANIDDAVAGAIVSKYRNAGQTCVCANTIYVQEGVYDAFVSKFVEAVQKLKVGSALEEGVSIGPLINQEAMAKVSGMLDEAKSKGAKIILGGNASERGGTFFEPTILTHVTTDMQVVRQEIFGPIAPIVSFSDEADMLAQVNDTPYGLAAYFYGTNIHRVWRVAEALEYGMIGINTGIVATAVAPFGGVKESGIGREGSKYGIEEYVEMKYLCFGGM